MKFEFNSVTPIYMQIINQIKKEIVTGERIPGSRVEPVRDMAQDLGVNPNTVQRAFAQLEHEGLMFAERTQGRYITADVTLINKVKEDSFRRNLSDFVQLMRNSGFSKADILKLLQNYLEGDKSGA